MRNKFYHLLKEDFFNYYKTEFQLIPIKQQKRICLLLNNKYLLLLYRKLITFGKDAEKAWQFIKYKYPEDININLGENRIQLSRDEELMMLSQRKYNITKLINSDKNIYETYTNRFNITNDNFWNDFIERQKNYNTYIVGGYKPVKTDIQEKKEEERTINNLFEDLEKDKYYYDCYETNYLYHNENMKKDSDNLKDKIKLLNDYSMNKMKDINYFSYSSFCLNAYNNKRQIKNRFSKKNTNISVMNEINMKEDSIKIYISNSNYKNSHTKGELLNKIKKMEIEYNEKKDKENSSYNTMKAINEEIHHFYITSKFEPSRIPVESSINSYLNFIFLIKDLTLFQKLCHHSYEKTKRQDEKYSPQKREHNEQMMKLRVKYEYNNKEINSIFDNLKKKMQKNDLVYSEKVRNFFIKIGEKTIKGLNK